MIENHLFTAVLLPHNHRGAQKTIPAVFSLGVRDSLRLGVALQVDG